MSAVGVRELKENTSEIVRRVREDKESIDVTYRGEVVARLVPVPRHLNLETINRLWDEQDQLAGEISKYWPDGLSAADANAGDRE